MQKHSDPHSDVGDVHACLVSLVFIEGDHISIRASAPHNSQDIARDEPPAAEQLKGKNIKGFGCSTGLLLVTRETGVLIHLVLSFDDASSVDV